MINEYIWEKIYEKIQRDENNYKTRLFLLFKDFGANAHQIIDNIAGEKQIFDIYDLVFTPFEKDWYDSLCAHDKYHFDKDVIELVAEFKCEKNKF